MAELIREPIGLRVLVRALRPEDREPFLCWRDSARAEVDALIEAGAAEDQALLWASLLRWSEAEAVAARLAGAGWEVKLHGVRAIGLARAVMLLRPPAEDQGWTLTVGELVVRAVPEEPAEDEAELLRLLAFLEDLE